MRTNIDENIKILKKEIELKEKEYIQIKYQTQLIKGALSNGYKKLKKILKEYNIQEDSISKKKLKNKYRKTKDYIKNNNQTKEKILEINSLTSSNTEKIQDQINNEQNYTKINNNIDNSGNKFMNSELTNNEFRENEEENDSINSFIENVRKKSNPNQPSISDYLESKNL